MLKTSLLRHNRQLIVFSLMLLLFLGALATWGAHQHFLAKTKSAHIGTQTALLKERIDKKEKILHGVMLALSQNSAIQKALAYEDRDALDRELGHLRETFSTWTGFDNYGFHAITFDGRSLYRSYDPDSFGQDVSAHPMLQQAMSDLTAAVTRLELSGFGDAYRVVSIQPVFSVDDPQELVGFITVSQGLKQVLNEFSDQGHAYAVFRKGRVADSDSASSWGVDKAAYFSGQAVSDWRLNAQSMRAGELHEKGQWFYFVQPLNFDASGDAPEAYHLVATPRERLLDQAWEKTFQVIWVLIAALIALVLGGLMQLGLLHFNVLKPLRGLTQTMRNIVDTQRYDQPVWIDKDDEIGEVSQAFNQLLQTTNRVLFDLKYLKIAIDQTLIVSRAAPTGTITDVNDNFCEISGYAREELIGQPHSIIRHPDTPSETFRDLWATIQRHRIWSGEIQNRRKDGSSYHVMSHIIPILDAEGRLVEYLSIRQDISLIVALRESLQASAEEAQKEKALAQEANQAKSQFLSSMSHELRTPLNAIIGFSQLMELSEMGAQQTQQLQTIQASGKHLLQLINDILEFAKLEVGQLPMQFAVTDMVALTDEATQLIAADAKAQGIRLESEHQSGAAFAYVDALRARQVMINLLSNAIKYNRPEGRVSVTSRQVDTVDGQAWQLQVADTGIGMSPEQLSQLFEPFNRLGQESSGVEGTGIGLSITRDLIEQMHGRIEVRSQPGQGTAFLVYFPLVEAGESVDPDSDRPVPDPAARKPSDQTVMVLCVDSDPGRMAALSEAVEPFDRVTLKIAPTWDNAQDQWRHSWPHVVVLNACDSEVPERVATLKAEYEEAGHALQLYGMVEKTDQAVALCHQTLFDALLPLPIDQAHLHARLTAVRLGL
ncbi:MAG: ATP-binding protein [Hydrogenovibrio sp.]|uniref:ATP-binding protein n=1 Tax=Hydrogenovibrio sp. TaxID=2065821 RepID=UPI0028700324|nr:ATP-binding protein [Hydrogenovibrio sp.]MDR9498038.1 ATP-binding protein [Hydrogenovibrio sp.]